MAKTLNQLELDALVKVTEDNRKQLLLMWKKVEELDAAILSAQMATAKSMALRK